MQNIIDINLKVFYSKTVGSKKRLMATISYFFNYAFNFGQENSETARFRPVLFTWRHSPAHFCYEVK